ncbi:hypothetical protein EGR_04917 [Echinococcus granulosus]|uniref:Uncharacterized protein n=1 Tax=Echinococcus granulosus TaxID=6210 RepID=W6UPK9_ECHGR|nr:hypothetical protein EGR_04917 [Echinococcus granulosus]EUB60207.1 hypothetical protein EGR_04917 [Echinococcus granulosus]
MVDAGPSTVSPPPCVALEGNDFDKREGKVKGDKQNASCIKLHSPLRGGEFGGTCVHHNLPHIQAPAITFRSFGSQVGSGKQCSAPSFSLKVFFFLREKNILHSYFMHLRFCSLKIIVTDCIIFCVFVFIDSQNLCLSYIQLLAVLPWFLGRKPLSHGTEQSLNFNNFLTKK